MHDKTRSLRGSLLTLVLMLVAGTPATLGTSPGPMLPSGAGGSGGGGATDGSPDETGPAKDEAPQADCQVGGPRPLTDLALGTTGLSLILAAYPAPLMRVTPAAQPPCSTELSLALTVASRRGQKPDGADATVEDMLVPRSSLEAGFHTELDAGDLTIPLSDPGEEWELTAVSCSCSGGPTGAAALVVAGPPGSPVGQLASYPTPVFHVGSGVTGGSTNCAGSVAAAAASLADAPSVNAAAGTTGRTVAPRPMLPRPPAPQPDGQPVPASDPNEPPPRRAATVSWSPDGTISVIDPEKAGAIATCDWAVEHVNGWVKVVTITEPPGREGALAYRLTPSTFGDGRLPMRLTGSPSGDERLARHDAWSLETIDPGKGWELKSSDCSESDSESATTAQGASATVGVDPGDRIVCTFRWQLLTPLPGPWKAVNHAGKGTCSAGDRASVTVRFGEQTGRGRIIHHDGGDHLELKGSGAGLISVDVYRDGRDPLRYRGTATHTFSGLKTRFVFDYRAVSDKRMTGSLTATWKQGDRRCVFKRKTTLTYAGR